MRISMIAATTKNRVIGRDNQMPWHLPDDLKFFKAKTLGKPVIMGRKTFESIGSKPLPGRPNIVISRNSDYQPDGVQVFPSVDQALAMLDAFEEVIIMGGGQLYSEMLSKADRLYLTVIDTDLEGDTFFPDWTQFNWVVSEREQHDSDDRHAYPFEFITLDKA
ncbi:type 3 dihydrofolate reductase [Thiomicrorhabdus sp. zzn3]|uniref:type 3 dihydrofolate reductase n=1 Tax=Thiomicrorhabdus sp. zzn3 TaxID=3039775 RepID=UPI0024370659|nr:type 3 dihydrofolate reductase [Thiomicrorhabdus sp. zzn3]MDG6778497.1 type 3 dihydrofolate reductase [Thiomicrorhabdus sp. zzn3]